MRPAHTLPSLVLAACMVAALLAFAPVPAWAHAPAARPLASDPVAATLPLHHLPLSISGELVAVPTDWRSAHEAVAEFPRGHTDILLWEAGQARATTAPAAAHTMPIGVHHHAPAPRSGGQP